ncbi:hypothetical protein PMI13_00232 [Chryseobacterium populi]|uniref:Uncharacterized protein n=2 Tax=Chryseobacterium populi TaxID=1144316 RepID=J3CPU4_9FLAO|nr:hypothetical protein PMI13_00232 [Chryseobacterium populi]
MLISVMACHFKKTPDKMQYNTDLQYNKEVTLTGTYTKSTLVKRGMAGHSGHYKIVINNYMEVNLLPPYHKESVRPEEEVEKFEGKKVAVTGIITQTTAFSEPSLEDQPLTVNIPCFITIKSIRLAEE